MENSNFIVRIPEPCHEDWNKMTPDANGKFCGSCCKTVIDFTNKSDLEIKTILLERKDQKVCGHFNTSQVDRPLNISIDFNNLPKNMSSTKTFALAIFLVFGTMLFNCTDAKAQKVGKIKISTTEMKTHVQGGVGIKPTLVVKGDVVAEDPDTLIKPINPEQLQIAGGIRFEPIVENVIIPDEIEISGEIGIFPIDTIKEELIIPIVIPQDSVDAENVESNFTSKLQNITGKAETNNSNEITDKLSVLSISSFGVYPNPNNGEFTIKYEVLKRANVRVDILDLQGALVKTVVEVSNQYEGKYQIPVSTFELANGIYLVSIINNGTRITERIVIEK